MLMLRTAQCWRWGEVPDSVPLCCKDPLCPCSSWVWEGGYVKLAQQRQRLTGFLAWDYLFPCVLGDIQCMGQHGPSLGSPVQMTVSRIPSCEMLSV